MALGLTGILKGVELGTDDGLVAIAQVPISGLPSANLTLLDTLGQGSKAYSDNGKEYRKETAGSGADKWIEAGNTSDISWREPALVKEDTLYANIAAAEVAMNLGTVDGVAVSSDDRILYTNITGSNKNVYIVTGTVGAGATLVEDTNAATINDVIRIDDGAFAEQVFYFDGAEWVAPDAAILAELTNIRAYIGKPSAGAVLPDYTSNNVVVDNDDLTVAISKLDAVANKPKSTAVPAATPTVVDSVLVDDIRRAVWEVSVYDAVSGGFGGITVSALHNGTGAADATLTDSSGIALDRIGNIPGADYTITLTGAGAAQTMNLQVTTNNATTVDTTLTGRTAAT